MQQKYLHEHRLSNNLINNKLREEMYLKHLREVEKINNRDTQTLREQIKRNFTISEMHKNNKIKAHQFNLKEVSKWVEDKNVKIYSKITSIGDYNMENKHKRIKGDSCPASHSSGQYSTNNSPSESRQKSIDSTDPKKHIKPSFHYRYRKRQQQHIEIQNAKLMKAILCQRSTILPLIGSPSGRSSAQLNRSANIQDKSPTHNVEPPK